MSLFRRRLMAMQPGITGESPEFIEFRRDRYVDTGMEMDGDLKVSLKIRFHSADSSASLLCYKRFWCIVFRMVCCRCFQQ